MELRKIAEIARIHLEEDQIPMVEQKLNDVYKWLEEIKKIDVSGLEPLYNVHKYPSATVREVENPEFYSPSVVLVNTPVKANDFILVPKVVEK